MYELHYPKSETLKKHIVSFTILKPFDEEINYYAFPQRGSTLALLPNAQVNFRSNEMNISNDNKAPQLIQLGKYIKPLKITYKNYTPEIGINFTETGINYFFKNYFTNHAINEIQLTNGVEEFNFEALFSKQAEDRINCLETNLLDIYNPIDISNIEKAVKLIIDNPKILTRTIAQEVHLTEKTFNRKFKEYVGCTSTQFKQIVRFRNTIQTYFDGKVKNLTELCFDNNYCDSPDFYRQISKLSSFIPRDFFRDLTKIGVDNYPYILK